MSSAIIKNLPNLLTLINLAAGVCGIFLILANQFEWVFLCFLISLIADLFDGMLARMLNAQGPMGIQLDSLADLVSFGVLPVILLFGILQQESVFLYELLLIGAAGLLYSSAATWRLAKFNISDDQQDDFSGLPSPAAGLLIVSFCLFLLMGDVLPVSVYIAATVITLLSAFLMVSRIRFTSLKFKSTGLRKNFTKYLIIILCPLPLIIFGYSGAFYSILIYILISITGNFSAKRVA